MKPKYGVEWLLQKIRDDGGAEYLFFWGHAHKHNGPVGKACFSQWFASPFTVEGTTYKTAEHWMMAKKALLFEDVKTAEKIIQADAPNEAKKLGRTVSNFNEEKWNEHRFELVKEGNVHKFNQHPPLANYLSGTGDKIIVEASPVDAIWGIGLPEGSPHAANPYGWRGLNLLGFALMEVRDVLRETGFGNNR